MRNHNPENERIKRRYFSYLKEARRRDEASIDGVAKALNRFETYARFRPFRDFRIELAAGFKQHLASHVSERTGAPLSKATLYSTLKDIKSFFQWLAGQQGFKSRIAYSDAEYFNLSAKDARIATARRERPTPTLEQISHAISTMPAQSEIERRDRAIVAFTILTGARDGAIASLKLKHIDALEGLVNQDAREVKTKASKTITTWFFPVGPAIRQIVVDWVDYLRKERHWGGDDPLFPATEVHVDANQRFAAIGLARKHWSNAGPIRAVFKSAFERAGLPYFNPHSFRKTLALMGEKRCKSPEEFKAWSQNLGHDDVMTTFNSYGGISLRRQAEIIRELECPLADDTEIVDLAKKLVAAATSKRRR